MQYYRSMYYTVSCMRERWPGQKNKNLVKAIRSPLLPPSPALQQAFQATSLSPIPKDETILEDSVKTSVKWPPLTKQPVIKVLRLLLVKYCKREPLLSSHLLVFLMRVFYCLCFYLAATKI